MLWPKLVCFAFVSLAFGQLEHVAADKTIAACPTNFTRVADKCLLIDDSWKNFYESDRHCRSINAGLLSLKNQTELNAINNWLAEVAPNQPEFWTSGNKLGEARNDYFWQSTGEQAVYLPWNTGQPTPASGDCLALLAHVSMSTGQVVMDPHRLTVKNCTQWAAHICQAPLQLFQTQLCLNTSAFFEAKIAV
ncbi:C-type mannose receptor 2-like [Drosophila gunungcola]|uniref:C-type mannose receptor 2-like n=1 Tax=Drosophila gunungcola TaxID=103775 RepID=UPI0022E2E00F|nr:C-type mannose receptor 2-like [Drosophila gunungcola]